MRDSVNAVEGQQSPVVFMKKFWNDTDALAYAATVEAPSVLLARDEMGRTRFAVMSTATLDRMRYEGFGLVGWYVVLRVEVPA